MLVQSLQLLAEKRRAAADWLWRSAGWHGNGSVRHGDAEGRGPVASITALTPQLVNICRCVVISVTETDPAVLLKAIFKSQHNTKLYLEAH